MSVDSERDLEGLRRVGRVVARTLLAMGEAIRPGVTTADVDRVGAQVLDAAGATSAPHASYGFPGATCISINDEAVHGIPGDRPIEPGDLVKLDVTAALDGYVADSAITVAVPPAESTAVRLRECAASALRRALRAARAGSPLNSIGRAVEREVRGCGFNVIRELSGHGVGRRIHEPPVVPNYYDRTLDRPLTEGLVITIEPIIAAGSGEITLRRDGWTLATADGTLAAHVEHTVVITRGRPIILTAA